MAKDINEAIIESLRNGIPPERGVEKYSVGHEKLIEDIKKYHLSKIEVTGKIRFICGSWGSGKTHLFRLIRDKAFEEGCAVSNVELTVNEAPLNRFQKVFFNIVENISIPNYYPDEDNYKKPFESLIETALIKLGNIDLSIEISPEQLNSAITTLMKNRNIHIDFKKIVKAYWETYMQPIENPALVEEKRQELLQWFAGEGDKRRFREIGVTTMVTKENARGMLKSLVEFIKTAGYKGLVILFDEAEQSYSIMRKSTLREAHNNLLSLINSIEDTPGLFMVYATTPDFYTDHKYGIVVYGALSSRIGEPQNKPPNALDTIWNLDAIEPQIEDYKEVARKIRQIYISVYPEAEEIISKEKEIDKFVENLYGEYPSSAPSRFWRILPSALIKKFDTQLAGEHLSDKEIYDDIMQWIRKDNEDK